MAVDLAPADSSAPARPTRGRSKLRIVAWLVVAVAIGYFTLPWFRASEPAGAASGAVDAVFAAAPATESGPLSGEPAVRFCRLLVEDAHRQLEQVAGFVAVFRKRERVDGELLPLNVMDLKVRREPLSVYMRWQEPNEGREITWQDGLHESQILVRAGGWRRNVVPLLKIDPEGDQARKYSRRPVSSAGLWNLNDRLLDYLRNELPKIETVAQMADDVSLGERPCYCFRFVHQKREQAPTTRKVVIFIDKQLSLVVGCETYSWADAEAGAEDVLEESYVFCNVALNPTLVDAEFNLEASDSAESETAPAAEFTSASL